METNGQSLEFAGGTRGEHRHICAFFNSIDEEHRVLRSFIKDGFDSGDRALHIIDPELREEHLRKLSEAGIDVDGAIESGQLDVRLWQDAYLRDDRFDQDAMLALIEDELRSAAMEGSRHLRLLAHMEWSLLGRAGVEDLLEYETRLNYVVPKYEDPVVCTYDLSKFGATVVMDALRTHPVVLIGGLLQENPFFVPPDEFLLEIRERAVGARERTQHTDGD
jgi:hypothetical protein